MTEMTALFDKISALTRTAGPDLDHIERTLTDGYAHALNLEAERWRLEKRIAKVAQGIDRGDTSKKAHELSTLARRLDGNAGELTKLRALLSDLRRRADEVRPA